MHRVFLNPQDPQFGKDHLILRGVSRVHSAAEVEAPLSLKKVIHGDVTWGVERRRYHLDSSTLLLLNDGQPYSVEIAEETPAETFVLFFARGALESGANDALDDPHACKSRCFPELTFAAGGPVDARLLRLYRSIRDGQPSLAVEEQIFQVAAELTQLIAAARGDRIRQERSHPSGRDELIRRLLRSKALLDSQYREDVSLRDLAGEACLSEFHFLRSFKRIFGQTPHQYQTGRRMEWAAHALRTKDWPVELACHGAGYTSVPTFTRVFRAHYGAPPGTWKKSKIG